MLPNETNLYTAVPSMRPPSTQNPHICRPSDTVG